MSSASARKPKQLPQFAKQSPVKVRFEPPSDTTQGSSLNAPAPLSAAEQQPLPEPSAGGCGGAERGAPHEEPEEDKEDEKEQEDAKEIISREPEDEKEPEEKEEASARHDAAPVHAEEPAAGQGPPQATAANISAVDVKHGSSKDRGKQEAGGKHQAPQKIPKPVPEPARLGDAPITHSPKATARKVPSGGTDKPPPASQADPGRGTPPAASSSSASSGADGRSSSRASSGRSTPSSAEHRSPRGGAGGGPGSEEGEGGRRPPVLLPLERREAAGASVSAAAAVGASAPARQEVAAPAMPQRSEARPAVADQASQTEASEDTRHSGENKGRSSARGDRSAQTEAKVLFSTESQTDPGTSFLEQPLTQQMAAGKEDCAPIFMPDASAARIHFENDPDDMGRSSGELQPQLPAAFHVEITQSGTVISEPISNPLVSFFEDVENSQVRKSSPAAPGRKSCSASSQVKRLSALLIQAERRIKDLTVYCEASCI